MSRGVRIGQIDLFTRRIRQAAAPKERELHIAVADTLARAIAPGWLWFHPANGEYRSHATGALLQRMGVKPGVSDFVLIGPPRGRVHCLELKRRGSKPTAEQIAFIANVLTAGGEALWVDSYEATIAALQEWGALDPRFHPQ